WQGDAELDLADSPWDEPASLLPVREIIGGYYRQVGVSWNGGTTLLRRSPGGVSRERDEVRSGVRPQRELIVTGSRFTPFTKVLRSRSGRPARAIESI